MTCSVCGSPYHSRSKCPMKDAMKSTAILFAFLLTGCASLDGKLENRIACTVAKDKLFSVSEFGPIGITSKIHDADRQVVCK